MSEKITDHHLTRQAILYVRQSSAYQVLHNEESRRLQYAMEHRLRSLGWREIEVIDDDLGRSAAGTVERAGFQRMVTAVCLKKVGVVAAREVSRFARNSRDWQQLIEVCRLVDTLLIDQETVYDPRNSNDRLLLGLKGSLNEYELDLLRQRSLEARQEKARRGELIVNVPVGYRKASGGKLEKDPDLRVQNALRLIYDRFLTLGTVRQTMMWFIEQGLTVPVTHPGPDGWQTVWKRPSYRAILAVLRNPVYAGAYAYGRTEATTAMRDGSLRKVQRRKRLDECGVLIKEHHEGYIAWEEFERIDEMISRNAQAFYGSSPGAPKKGAALLAGLLRCRRCGRKITVRYTGNTHDIIRYVCARGSLDQGEARCITFGGTAIDDAISLEVLRVVQPGAVEAALRGADDKLDQKSDALKALTLELEAARYDAERVARQYDAADPENRLVVDELERRWNAALERIQEIERRMADAEAERSGMIPPPLQALGDLAADLDAVWSAPGTDAQQKKRIVRALIEEVLADIDQEASEVVLMIHWKGGLHSELRVHRRKRGEHRAHTPPETLDVIRALALILPDTSIAGFLNRNGYRTGRGNRWTEERVRSLRTYHAIPLYSEKESGWLNLSDSASYLGVTPKTLRRAAERGHIKAMHPLGDGPWIFKREDLDDPHVQRLIRGSQEAGGDPAGPNFKQLSLDLPTT